MIIVCEDTSDLDGLVTERGFEALNILFSGVNVWNSGKHKLL